MSAKYAFAAAVCMTLLAAPAAHAQTAVTKPAVAARPATFRAQPTPQADATFAALDMDDSGALSLQEFRNGWRNMRRASGTRRLNRRFHALDANHNNAIDAGEYPKMVLLRRAGKAAPPLATFDANHNGRLELAEYLALVNHLTQRRTAAPPARGGRRK